MIPRLNVVGATRHFCSDVGMGAEILYSGQKNREGKRVIWSSEQGSTVDALELSGEEGRGKLRKAAGRSKHPVIRR